MAALEPYYFEPKLLHTPKRVAVKIAKCIIAWEKNNFVDFVKGANTVAGFSPSGNFARDAQNYVT